MKLITVVVFAIFLSGCATVSTDKFDLEPYKKMSCEDLRETRVQLDIERQKISWPSTNSVLLPIAGWIYYGVKSSSAQSQLVDIETKRTAIRSQQKRCSKVDLFQ